MTFCILVVSLFEPNCTLVFRIIRIIPLQKRNQPAIVFHDINHGLISHVELVHEIF